MEHPPEAIDATRPPDMPGHPLDLILHVEDDDDHALLLARALRRIEHDCELERIPRGEDAAARVRGQGPWEGRPRPRLILLDLNLPGTSGLDVLAELKGDATTCDIPVVVLTTSDATLDRARAYLRHANSYLLKPPDFDGICRLVDSVVSYWLRTNRPSPDSPAPMEKARE